MSWYLAKTIFRICAPGEQNRVQFEEQLHLVQASSQMEALQKASALGEKEDAAFQNAAGETVRWQFIAVPELQRIPELLDGLELSSRIEEMEDPENYIALQRDKHVRLFLCDDGIDQAKD